MKTAAIFGLTALLLSGCEAPECVFTEGTGLFEVFKTKGCFAVDVSLENSGGLINANHNGNLILLNGIDSLNINLNGRLYTGREGMCGLSDGDATVFENQSGHCDYVVRSFNKVSEKESRYTVEVLDAHMSWKGKQGDFKALFNVQSFNQGF